MDTLVVGIVDTIDQGGTVVYPRAPQGAGLKARG
jgi:hypothetical protein